MPPKRRISESSSEPALKRQQTNPMHVTYCVKNSATLTFPAFCQEFRLFKKEYAYNRYKNIISTYLENEDAARLAEEFNLWKQSLASKEFWVETTRAATTLEAQLGSAQYVQQEVLEEINILSNSLVSETAAASTIPTDSQSTSVGNASTAATTSTATEALQPEDNLPAPREWMFNGHNISQAFRNFRQAVINRTSTSLLHIESSVHEALALNHVLLLAPQQHSPLLLEHFADDVLDDLIEDLVDGSLKSDLNPNDVLCGNVSRIVMAVQSRKMSIDDGKISLTQLCKEADPSTACAIRGICRAMEELPVQAIKNQQCEATMTKHSMSENELTTSYYHPILAAILSNPSKRVHLRWTNKQSDCSGDLRPDGTITLENQLVYGASMGFGEAKVAEPTTNNNGLCLDLLRLGMFCKEAVDTHHWNACLGFQIHGFMIVFYLMKLQHDGVYTMFEIARLTFPRSLQELSTFVSLSNLQTLARVSEAFWRLCKAVPAADIDVMTSNSRPTYSYTYNLIDSSKSKSRSCALRFE